MRSRPTRAASVAALLAVGGIVAACAPPRPPAPPPSGPSCSSTPPASSSSASTPTPQQPVTYSAVVETPSGAPEAKAFTATSDNEKDAKVQQLEQKGTVKSVEPVQPVRAIADTVDPNVSNEDPLFSQQWGLGAQPGANFPSAWANNLAGATTRIAIVDTGVRLTHQNFSGQVVAGPDLVTDPNGSVAVTGDPHGHGTHTAGIAGAKDNDTGTLGGAPNSTIVAVRVLNSCGSGSSTDVANGITWAADPARGHAQVISLSLGGAAATDMKTAVEYAKSQGVVVVAAAGNDGGSSCNTSAVEYPGGYSTDTAAAVIAVAATDSAGNVAPYSNCGSFVSIAAPGSDILSTYGSSDSAYIHMSGTSMATPAVAAAAALMIEKCPSIPLSQLPGRVRLDLQTNSVTQPNEAFHRLDAGVATSAAC